MNSTQFETHDHEEAAATIDVDAAAERRGRGGRGTVVAIVLFGIASALVARRIRAQRAERAAKRREIGTEAVGYANDLGN
jgi:crotonobetainyl-CoA:carnitine CoA-transferase CaiB-like acyl-CoA transferase